MSTNSPVEEVTQAELTTLIQKALNRPAAQISSWKVHSIHGGLELNSSVFRFQGEASNGAETFPWSMILKTIKSTEKANDPAGIWYWKRESLAYQSGLLHRLPGGNITAPACFAVREQPDGSVWLWIEDVKEDISNPWPIENYGTVARQLGQFNGAYLTGQSIPAESWVTHNWLRMYIQNATPMIQFIHQNPQHPIVRRMFPGGTLNQILAIWDEHEAILEMLENLPQVFCHQDAFRRNLFSRGGRTVAIDWGYFGNAPVGAELVALVAGSMGLFEIPADRVMELDQLCFEGYLQGLRDSGWNADPKVVRTGYAVSLLLRYPIGGSVGEMLPRFLDEAERSNMEAAFENKTAADLEQSDPAIIAYYEKVLPEALKLLGMKRLLRLVSRIGWYTLRLRPGKSKSRT